jgi:hypothetical protein
MKECLKYQKHMGSLQEVEDSYYCFRILNYEGSTKLGGTGFEWDTSASGLC